jgi:very-short-patch-repair endonuclease
MWVALGSPGAPYTTHAAIETTREVLWPVESGVMSKLDDKAIAELAARQRGVVSVEQLHAAGFDRAAIKRRLRAGRLHRLHRGVYLVGHAIAAERALEFAALLACGPQSVVSHRSAARLLGLPSFRNWTAPVEVSVSGYDPGCKPGIKIYRPKRLDARDVRCVDGIRVTAPACTLLDLAVVLPIDDLEVAYADAHARRLLKPDDITAVLDRNRHRRGAGALRSLHALELGGGLSRSEAERQMRTLLRTAKLPEPKVNARVDSFEVDFLWAAEKVVVEVDGFAFHADRRSFERDRERDAILAARGYVVLRFTWRQILRHRVAVISRISSAITVRRS